VALFNIARVFAQGVETGVETGVRDFGGSNTWSGQCCSCCGALDDKTDKKVLLKDDETKYSFFLKQ
jgi:hypothetical protein